MSVVAHLHFRSLTAAIISLAVLLMPALGTAKCAHMASAGDTPDNHSCCKADNPVKRHHETPDRDGCGDGAGSCISACCRVPATAPAAIHLDIADQPTVAFVLPMLSMDAVSVSHAIFHPPRI